ncbi:MAG: sugar ABC transporter permease [Alphaproteobacteria bacterium]|nr:sugar ABC transporter permease [Alphaproteobacteria bacterium]
MTATLAQIRSGRVFYLFVAPFAALTILFGLWPILLSIQVSFTASATALRAAPTYVGFANYAAVLSDPIFAASLARTLIYTGLSVAANLAFALAAAMLLDSTLLRRANVFFRLAIFLPVVTPDVAGYVVWRWLFDRSFGAINAGLAAAGLPPFGGLASVDTVTAAVLIAELWHHAGFYMLIFLANLAIRDKALEEAAAIDGATTLQRWWFVVLPQLRPALVINLVYATIQFLKTFTVVVVMTKGGPSDRTNFVSYYAYQLFDQARYGEATAMATILFAIVAVLSLAAYRLGDAR